MENKEFKVSNNEEIAKNPIEAGQKSIDEILDENMDKLLMQNFMSTKKIAGDEDFRKPTQNRFLIAKWNKYYVVEYKPAKKKAPAYLSVRMVTNFRVINAKKIVKVFNNKSGVKNSVYYIIDIQSDTGCIIKNIEVKDDAKTDYKSFQKCLSNQENSFVTVLSEPEFKELIRKFIIPLLKITIYVYSNAGMLSKDCFLYKNALVEAGHVFKANEEGFIPTKDPNVYITLDDNVNIEYPTLSDKSTNGKDVAKKYVNDLIQSWGKKAPLAATVTGHMIMSIHYETFIKKIGVPTLLLSGASGSGKSTLVKNGIAIFGMSNKFLTAGSSTPKSHEFLSTSYNGISICSDDISDLVLNSNNFNATIKSAYHGSARTKMKNYGQELDTKPMCSPLAFSSNENLPQLPELRNRTNIFIIMKGAFEPKESQYLDKDIKNREELSLLLPEALKYSETDTLKIYDRICKNIEDEIDDVNVESRIISNIAYAATGAYILQEIAGVNIEDFDKFVLDYAKESIEKYKNIPSPIDLLLGELLTLKANNAIEQGKHYRIIGADKSKSGRVELHFHKKTLLSAYNKYFYFTESKKISEENFDNHLDFDKRCRTQVTRFEGKSKASVVIDITDIEELKELGGLYVMPAEELDSCNQS